MKTAELIRLATEWEASHPGGDCFIPWLCSPADLAKVADLLAVPAETVAAAAATLEDDRPSEMDEVADLASSALEAEAERLAGR
jgi:hypothetical protein